MNPTDPIPDPDNRWWCLRSQITGKLILRDTYVDDGHFDMRGPVGAYWSRNEAELDAIAHRETYPLLMIEAVPLPPETPERMYPVRHNDGGLAAAQVQFAVGDQRVMVELRPETLSESSVLIALLNGIIKRAAAEIPHARVSPLHLITLGPVGVQVELRNPAEKPDQEAA